MSAVRRPARWLVVAAMAAAPVALGAQSLAAGDTLQLRLLVPVRSERTPDSAVRALVIAPVMRDGRVLVPPGAVVTGRVAGAGVEKSGSKHHWLSLDFDQAAIPLGGPAPADTSRVQIATRVVAVDNAREEVDSTGRILGPPIPALVRSKRNWTVVALGAFSPVGAVVLAAALEAENAERHRAVAFDAGTELRAVVTRDSPPLTRWPAWEPPPALAADAPLDSVLISVPLRASFGAGGSPGDVVALAFLGSADEVRAAFAAAGWSPATKMTLRTDFVTFAKAARGEGYDVQPVSTLTLDGRAPDLAFEKLTDTFVKRHHVRIWRWPGAGDSTLWVAAATRDRGVEFSTARRTFTHLVDANIDAERAKIVGDLIAAGAVGSMRDVARPAPLGAVTVNDGRDAVASDWRMVVLRLLGPAAGDRPAP